MAHLFLVCLASYLLMVMAVIHWEPIGSQKMIFYYLVSHIQVQSQCIFQYGLVISYIYFPLHLFAFTCKGKKDVNNFIFSCKIRLINIIWFPALIFFPPALFFEGSVMGIHISVKIKDGLDSQRVLFCKVKSFSLRSLLFEPVSACLSFVCSWNTYRWDHTVWDLSFLFAVAPWNISRLIHTPVLSSCLALLDLSFFRSSGEVCLGFPFLLHGAEISP